MRSRQDTRARGLSPRVRGNQPDVTQRGPISRSIPACAGEPNSLFFYPKITRVYPRVCGGTPRGWAYGRRLLGLSPRVRGNPGASALNAHAVRSIPACAGEPHVRGPVQRPAPVYPRVCGGTHEAVVVANRAAGLSPRVRGNPTWRVRPAAATRSIPACAGEPWSVKYSDDALRVYPRVCGGTGG